jgi:subtilisin family serine protease
MTTYKKQIAKCTLVCMLMAQLQPLSYADDISVIDPRAIPRQSVQQFQSAQNQAQSKIDLMNDLLNHHQTSPQATSHQVNFQAAIDLDEEKGFYFDRTYHFNWGGQNEKWFRGKDGQWFYIIGGGFIHKWSGQSQESMMQNGVAADGAAIARVDNLFYEIPVLLHDAKTARVVFIAKEAGWDLAYGLNLSDPQAENWGQQNEVWFRGNEHSKGNDWYYVTRDDGKLYTWSGQSAESMAVNGTTPDGPSIDTLDLDTEIRPDNFPTFESIVHGVDFQTAIDLDERHGFYFDRSYHFNWGGQNEKWFKGEGGQWFYILESGFIHKWSGQNQQSMKQNGTAADGPPIAVVNPLFYEIPVLLHDAKTARVVYVARQAGWDITYGLKLSYPEAENWGQQNEVWFRGNEHSKGNDWYYVTRDDGRLYVWSGQSAESMAVNGTTLDGPPIDALDLDTEIMLDNPQAPSRSIAQNLTEARLLDTRHQLFLDQRDYFNWGGQNEKWFRGQDGQWYYIIPNGQVFAWSGQSAATMKQYGTLADTAVLHLSTRFYETPTLLYGSRENDEPLIVDITDGAGRLSEKHHYEWVEGISEYRVSQRTVYDVFSGNIHLELFYDPSTGRVIRFLTYDTIGRLDRETIFDNGVIQQDKRFFYSNTTGLLTSTRSNVYESGRLVYTEVTGYIDGNPNFSFFLDAEAKLTSRRKRYITVTDDVTGESVVKVKESVFTPHGYTITKFDGEITFEKNNSTEFKMDLESGDIFLSEGLLHQWTEYGVEIKDIFGVENETISRDSNPLYWTHFIVFWKDQLQASIDAANFEIEGDFLRQLKEDFKQAAREEFDYDIPVSQTGSVRIFKTQEGLLYVGVGPRILKVKNDDDRRANNYNYYQAYQAVFSIPDQFLRRHQQVDAADAYGPHNNASLHLGHVFRATAPFGFHNSNQEIVDALLAAIAHTNDPAVKSVLNGIITNDLSVPTALDLPERDLRIERSYGRLTIRNGSGVKLFEMDPYTGALWPGTADETNKEDGLLQWLFEIAKWKFIIENEYLQSFFLFSDYDAESAFLNKTMEDLVGLTWDEELSSQRSVKISDNPRLFSKVQMIHAKRGFIGVSAEPGILDDETGFRSTVELKDHILEFETTDPDGTEFVRIDRATEPFEYVIKLAAMIRTMDLAIESASIFSSNITVVEAYRELRSRLIKEKIEAIGTLGYPNDPYYYVNGSFGQDYEDLWNLRNINLTPEIWESYTGKGVSIAVVDGGIFTGHVDLASNVWTNSAEANGQDGVDDDGNGFIDDIYGWDFVDDDNDASTSRYVENGVVGYAPVGVHGSHVAGIAAAVGNNGKGIIGVAPEANIIPVRVLDLRGGGTWERLAEGIRYAAELGADIISLSLGGVLSSFSSAYQVVKSAVDFAIGLGSVIVASAGNSGREVADRVPSGLDNVITVAATDQVNARASFSNFGSEVFVSAPGVKILSIAYKNTNIGDLSAFDRYQILSGTSMAVPHVSGAIALLLQKYPGASLDFVMQRLAESSTDLGAAGRDPFFGYGLLNIEALLG